VTLVEEVAQDRPAGCGNGPGDVARRYAASLVARRLASVTVTRHVRATAHFVPWRTRHHRGDVSCVGRRDVEVFVSDHPRRCRCRPRVVQTRTDSRAPA
jgi:hypothetical protein